MHTNWSEWEQEQEQMNTDDVFRVFGDVLFCDFLSSFPIPFIIVRMSFVHKYKLTEKKIYWKCFDSIKSFDKLWYKNKPTTDLGGKRPASLPHPPVPASCVILSKIFSSNQTFFLSSQAGSPMVFPHSQVNPHHICWLHHHLPNALRLNTSKCTFYCLIIFSLSNPHLQSIAPSC